MVKVLFINGHGDNKWVDSLRQAVNNLGKSLILANHQLLKNNFQNYELIILDAGTIGEDELVRLIQHVRASSTKVRIVVVSSAPYWEEARQILLAGATDYVRKTDGREAILNILNGNISTKMHRGENSG